MPVEKGTPGEIGRVAFLDMERFVQLGAFTMKLFGYTHQSKAQPLELYEATLSADPKLLRELAAFLIECAAGIEARGASWNHAHFAPADDAAPKNGPEFVVFNPQAE